ncbi:MAG: type II toxin-antitoxin system RelE/ParE family toxin [Gammaproteobacteria bacterium]|nr:type II toxin-antitoxin system RelE/ParE family toxin [Gammaproteobacteria bacterium]MBY0544024.1 type II toxin-antitoxin system RelE/ParE family toxin [Gammaproteobacteria bacterium]
MKQKELRYYISGNGKSPFAEWLGKIRDNVTQARILRRLERMEMGHYGDYKSVGDGILELRLAFGSGYRVYFAEVDGITVILLLGGDKSTQSKDIQTAKLYWQELKGRTDEQTKLNGKNE